MNEILHVGDVIPGYELSTTYFSIPCIISIISGLVDAVRHPASMIPTASYVDFYFAMYICICDQ